MRSFPSVNRASSLVFSPCIGPPAPGGPPRTPGSFCARQRKVHESVTSAARRDSRELNFIPFLQVRAVDLLALCHREIRIQPLYPDILLSVWSNYFLSRNYPPVAKQTPPLRSGLRW